METVPPKGRRAGAIICGSATNPSKQRYIVGALHADGQGVAEVKVVVVGVGGGETLRPNCNVDVMC